MLINDDELFENAYNYAKGRHREILRQDSPGHGMEGRVWKTAAHSVIKAFYRRENFEIELACYQRLLEHAVNRIHGLEVPMLEDFDAGLRVIEMTFVRPPYLLDFGKASLDRPPDYLRDERDQRRFDSQGKSEFGDKWPEVNAILYTLKTSYGIYYLDPRPQNICFDEPDFDDDHWMQEPPIDYSEYD